MKYMNVMVDKVLFSDVVSVLPKTFSQTLTICSLMIVYLTYLY